MTAGKTLNTGGPVYASITRAVSADKGLPVLRALDGGADTDTQTRHDVISRAIPEATWTTAGQGIARTDANWYSITTASFRKYDLANNLIWTNASPFTNLPAGMNHCGDGFVIGDVLHLPVSEWDGAANVSLQCCIAKFDVSDGANGEYISHHVYTVSDPSFGGSGICLSKDQTEILGVSFDKFTGSSSQNTTVFRINRVTDLVVGTYTLDVAAVGIQSIVYHNVTDIYYIGSYDSTSSINDVYSYDTNFNFISVLDPSSSTFEMEGLESHNDILYFNMQLMAPRTINPDNMWVWAGNNAVKFLDNSLIADEGTILMRIEPGSLFNFNTVIDNANYANNWESWVYATGELAWRVSSAGRTSNAGIVTEQDFILALGWKKIGSNVEIRTGLNGVFSPTITTVWVPPPAGGLYLGGINGNNNRSNMVYKDVIVLDKVLTPAELTAASANNMQDNYTPDGAPTPQGTTTIDSVGVTTAAASVNYTYDATDATGFKYSLDGAPAVDVALVDPFSITGLTADTAYNVEVTPYNGAGDGTTSTPFAFQTAQVPAPTLPAQKSQNQLLEAIVIAVGGTVTQPVTRNSLLQNWLDAL